MNSKQGRCYLFTLDASDILLLVQKQALFFIPFRQRLVKCLVLFLAFLSQNSFCSEPPGTNSDPFIHVTEDMPANAGVDSVNTGIELQANPHPIQNTITVGADGNIYFAETGLTNAEIVYIKPQQENKKARIRAIAEKKTATPAKKACNHYSAITVFIAAPFQPFYFCQDSIRLSAPLPPTQSLAKNCLAPVYQYPNIFQDFPNHTENFSFYYSTTIYLFNIGNSILVRPPPLA